MKTLNLFTTLALSLIITYPYCQTGTLDPTFGAGGIVTTSFPGDNDGEAVAVQDDGKIVLVGTTDDPNGTLGMRVIRYLSDGTIDNTFGVNGTVVLTGPLSTGTAVAIQTDGKIVAVGTIDGGSNNFDMLIVRLNPDGTFDNSFGTAGMVSYNNTGAELGYGVALQTDGKIVVTGIVSDVSGADAIAVRFNVDGTTDTFFGISGIARVDVNGGTDYSEDVLIQDDGKIVLIGTHYASPLGDLMVVRLTQNGVPDASFGTNGNGIVLTDVALGGDTGTAGALQSDGKILVIGDTEINIGPLTHEEFITLRYNTDGTLDNSFNSGGYVTGDLDGGPDVGTSIAVQLDGSIVVAGDGMVEVNGDSISQIGMFRYLPDGSLDNTFGTGGKVITSIGSHEDLCNGMALQPDNGQYIILVGESADSTGDSDFTLVRYENTVGLFTLSHSEIPLVVYPNPVNSQSVIEYSLLREEKVSIKLYNLAGELIQSILDETSQEQGEHQQLLRIDGSLPHGNYLLKVQTSSSSMSIEIHI